MNKYAGTQTEKNLEAAFAESHRQEISIPTLHLLQKKRVMSKLPRSS